jgi:hypothetical protein
MTSQQYEELCRFFLADRLQMDIAQIQSVYVANKRRNAPWYEVEMPYRHQIDLYWESQNDVARYITIANAKWRAKDRVRQHDVLLLEMVRRKVGAHKAMMITNSGFTGAAHVVAMDEGIALLIVRPRFDSRSLHPTRRSLILQGIQELARKTPAVYAYEVVEKGFEPVLSMVQVLHRPAENCPSTAWRPACENVALPCPPMNPPGNEFPSAWGGSWGACSGPPVPGLSSYSTRQGPGPEFRMK